MTSEAKAAGSLAGRPFFCSWSGGKDSCLALYHAIQDGGQPRTLLTILSEDGEVSRSHALPKSVLREQAKSLGLAAVFCAASWQRYEEEFLSALREYRRSGIEVGVFGDIDVEDHLAWITRVCGAAGIEPILPLWRMNRRELLEEFIDLGFEARIIVINERKLDRSFLGRAIEARTIADIERAGIDPSGELGEYHTVVTDGPLFSSQVEIKPMGQEHHEDYWFLKVDL